MTVQADIVPYHRSYYHQSLLFLLYHKTPALKTPQYKPQSADRMYQKRQRRNEKRLAPPTASALKYTSIILWRRY
jgi:hypothetical protein